MSNSTHTTINIFKLARRGFIVVLVWIAFANCSKEQAIPVIADFSLIVVDNDYSVPVTVQIANNTVGAESYSWAFEGADRANSTDRNPGTLTYNEPGIYKITLQAANEDGSEDSKEIELSLDAAIIIGFDVDVLINNFAPATVAITNTTMGATSFQWEFEGGTPAISDEENPGNVIFAEPGERSIKLTVGNGRETHELEKTITVGEALVADFDWEVAFQDDDLQVPVTLTLQNKSTGALEYNWIFESAQPLASTEENPTIRIDETGIHTLTLTVSNGKETKMISKPIETFANTNLRTLEDVRFGINTAHNADVIGAFFSTTIREMYTKTEVQSIDGNLIDLVFFGLGSDFTFNKFVSPDALTDTTFEMIPDAQRTLFINSQEQCECTASLTEIQFDAMVDDSVLRNLTIEETDGGIQHFTNTLVPRIVLFQTADGRKGAIKIKAYVNDRENSYIITDIKIQKDSS